MNRGPVIILLTAAVGGAVLVACGSRGLRPTAAVLPPVSPTSTTTPAVFHTPTPSLSPTPSPTLDTASFMATALSLRDKELYNEEVALWNEYLAHDPSYVDGYYQRATALNWGAPRVGEIRPYLRENLAALEDLDHAIGFGFAADGRYFWRRFQVLSDFILVQPDRAIRDALTKLALDNLVAANSIGPWSDVSRGIEVATLADLGRCDEAIANGWRHLEDLERVYPSQPWAHARAQAQLGRAYNCAGRWAEAVEHYEQALALDPEVDHWTWDFWRSVNLYFLGRLDEAKEFLDRDIAGHPNYSGERYFLRAIILYDQGKVDEAMDDLQFGRFQTWRPDGLYWYVLGQIMIEQGDVEGGFAHLARAESTLTVEFAPLLERVRLQIQEAEGSGIDAGGEEALPDLYPTTFALLASGTPMPVLAPTPTPRAPFEISGLCGCDWRLFDLAQGTGPLLIRSELELNSLFTYIYRFQPPSAIRDDSAVDLTYRILPFGELSQGDPALAVEFYSPESQVIYGPGSWGDNRIHDLRAVGRGGEVTMVIRNVGVLPVYIQNLGMRLVSRDRGGYLIQQAEDIPFIQEDPMPPPSIVIGLDESTGALSLPTGNGSTIGFSPEEPIDYALVTELTILVEPAHAGEKLPMSVTPWSPWGGGWGSSEEVSPGEFQVPYPSIAVDLHGNVVVALMNQGTEALELANVSIRLVIQDADGIEHIFGLIR